MGFLWMMPTRASPTMLYRSSPSTMRGQKRWSTNWPPASLPPSKYLPTPLEVHVPDLSVLPLTQNSMNSPTVCSSAWLSLASMSSNNSSSAHDLSPNFSQYSPDFSLMIQMPSPAEPRF